MCVISSCGAHYIINLSQNILGAHNNINHKIYTKYAIAMTHMIKRPNTDAKETQYRGERNPIQRQKRPNTEAKET